MYKNILTKGRLLWECETCGTDYAVGGKVYIDGELVIDAIPVAHCFCGRSFEVDELLVLALKELGHTVEVGGRPYHISCNYEG